MSFLQTRRSFLQTLGAAPIAALAPWRPEIAAGFDLASGPDYCAVIAMQEQQLLAWAIVNPLPIGEVERELLAIQQRWRDDLAQVCGVAVPVLR